MRDAQNLQELIVLKPTFIGFIFYPKSKRFVGNDFSAQITDLVPKTIQKVGVFVHQDIDFVLECVQKYTLDAVQLHGSESVPYCAFLKNHTKVIKVFSIGQNFDFGILDNFVDVADYFLFDTTSPHYGGSGQKFDWDLLQKNPISKPFFLSGGIGQEDAALLKNLEIPNLVGFDLNSRFEISPALKDIDKLALFFKNLA